MQLYVVLCPVKRQTKHKCAKWEPQTTFRRLGYCAQSLYQNNRLPEIMNFVVLSILLAIKQKLDFFLKIFFKNLQPDGVLIFFFTIWRGIKGVKTFGNFLFHKIDSFKKWEEKQIFFVPLRVPPLCLHKSTVNIQHPHSSHNKVKKKIKRK